MENLTSFIGLSLKLFLVGVFSLQSGPTSSALYLTEVSEDWGFIRILRDIKPLCVQLPGFCYPYSQDTLIMTGINKDSPAVHFVTNDEDVHIKFTFKNNNVSFKFPFDICETNRSFFVSDSER